MIRHFVLLGALLPAGIVLPASAQDPGSIEQRAQASLRSLDVNEDGWLDGTEVTRCGCGSYDMDGNGEITGPEFLRGYALAFASGQPLPGAPRGEAAPGGAASPQKAAAPARAIQPASPQAGSWRAGERVEVLVDGAWHRASVIRMGTGAEAGQVRVTLDGYTYGTSDVRWVDAPGVRRLAAAPTPAAAPRQGSPGALPAGLYVCTTSYTSQTASSQMTLGRLRLRPDGSYTGLSSDGTGAGGRYRYDPASGQVDWVDGLRGFSGFPTGTRVSRDARGAPLITVTYQVREGGSEYSMDCAREPG